MPRAEAQSCKAFS